MYRNARNRTAALEVLPKALIRMQKVKRCLTHAKAARANGARKILQSLRSLTKPHQLTKR